MLFVGLQAGRDAFLGGAASGARGWKGAEVRVLDESQPGTARRYGGDVISLRRRIGPRTAAEAPRAIEKRGDLAEVGCAQSVHAILPVLPAKRADGQVQLHDVVELAVAAEYLHLAIFEDVPSSADPRRNLVGPAEVDGVVGDSWCSTFARQILFVEPDASVDGNAMADRPGILHEQSVVKAGRFSQRTEVLYGDVTELTRAVTVCRGKGETSSISVGTGRTIDG